MEPLPIDPMLPEIRKAVREHPNVVLTATPGAGKTTRLPPELLNAVEGRILVLQPRRMAAIAACGRVCEERNWPIGGAQAGYQVRFETRAGPQTRLLYMTDALLLRRMVDDPELRGVDLVVLDEFHERNLSQDLILGSVLELQELGRDIKLLVMSATLEPGRLADFLKTTATIDVPGAIHPLEIRHSREPLSGRVDADFIERVCNATLAAEREGEGDILVFLPGTGEIARVEEKLSARTRRVVAPLHGSLPLAEQRSLLAPSNVSRIILSTNVAEASVTVAGVDKVVDCGLSRSMEMNTRTGFSSLKLGRISQFSARQRAGRAARQKPGLCWRLWTPHEEQTQDLEGLPECQRVDLTTALLWLTRQGITDPGSFAWYDPPTSALLNWATRELQALDARDKAGRLTSRGEKLVHYPLEPRWGAMLELGDEMGMGPTAARIAAILQDRDFAAGWTANTDLECDVLARLELLDEIERGSSPRGVDMRQARSVLQAADQLTRLVVGKGAMPTAHKIKRLLLLSQRARLCRRRGNQDRAVMSHGRGVRIGRSSQVRASEFLLALQGVDLSGQADTLVNLACGFNKDFLLSELGSELRQDREIVYDDDRERLYRRTVRAIDGLAIEEPTLTSVPEAESSDALAAALADRWDLLVKRHPDLGRWMRRWRFLVRHEPQFEASLGPEQIREALNHAAYGRDRLAEVLKQDLPACLEAVLGREVTRAMQALVPERFLAPSGVSHPIEYDEDHGAFLDVRLQELFGLRQTPRLVNGKAALTFRLLSPGFKPVQVTSDLENFWRVGYAEVRKELRTRYPKHAWPEDPYAAIPVAKGRRR